MALWALRNFVRLLVNGLFVSEEDLAEDPNLAPDSWGPMMADIFSLREFLRNEQYMRDAGKAETLAVAVQTAKLGLPAWAAEVA
jgi:hypothetical protein